MQSATKILVLSGTREGVEVIQRLQEKQVDVIASVAGDARTHVTFTAPVHFGGFATQTDFADFLGKNEITHVLDASHPNDPMISVQTQLWCRAVEVKFLNITRSGWHAKAGDRWHTVAREADVVHVITDPSRVFLATGRMRLSKFSNLDHCYLYCRQIDVAPDAGLTFNLHSCRYTCNTSSNNYKKLPHILFFVNILTDDYFSDSPRTMPSLFFIS